MNKQSMLSKTTLPTQKSTGKVSDFDFRANKQQVVYIHKKYKEFKELHLTLLKTFQDDQESLSFIPSFPERHNEMGSEVLTQLLQQQLDTYLNSIIATRQFDSLICIQTFFSEGIVEIPSSMSQKQGTFYSQGISPMNSGKTFIQRDTTPINFDPNEDEESEEEENSPFRVTKS
mmetsp:Transcript_32304/g.31607  ORF Transcript_32304/g.31607 Transcript_32304/m.31607 type:complete len:174 (+) Transcript_32304:754-1275(+)